MQLQYDSSIAVHGDPPSTHRTPAPHPTAAATTTPPPPLKTAAAVVYGGNHRLDTRRRRHLQVAISTVPDISGSGQVNMLTRPIVSAQVLLQRERRVKLTLDMYLTRGSVGAQALFSPIRGRINKKRAINRLRQ